MPSSIPSKSKDKMLHFNNKNKIYIILALLTSLQKLFYTFAENGKFMLKISVNSDTQYCNLAKTKAFFSYILLPCCIYKIYQNSCVSVVYLHYYLYIPNIK